MFDTLTGRFEKLKEKALSKKKTIFEAPIVENFIQI
jgi:hypothetical protein